MMRSAAGAAERGGDGRIRWCHGMDRDTSTAGHDPEGVRLAGALQLSDLLYYEISLIIGQLLGAKLDILFQRLSFQL